MTIKAEQLTHLQRLANLQLPTQGRLSVVIDTDAYNEVDDQFAIAWALLKPEKLDVQAIYAAPFSNDCFADNERSEFTIDDPKIGMDKSVEEINRVLAKLTAVPKLPKVFRGSTRYFAADDTETSDAVQDLITRAEACEGILHVVCIAAATNIANAITIKPAIIHKIHVIWLGGHDIRWPDTKEFNLMQNIEASRVLFDSGVALTWIPCMGVANTLATSVPEIQHYLEQSSEIGCYLSEITKNIRWISFANRKVIWDIANIGFLLDESWFDTELIPAPVLNDNLTWSFNFNRHQIRYVRYIHRDYLFADLFRSIMNADKPLNR